MSTSWRTARLGQVVNIAIGRTPPRAESSCWDPGRTTGNVWLSIADLTAMTGRVIDDSKEYISNRAAADCRLVPQGTLLMSFKLSIGKLAFAGVPLYTNEAIAALTVIDPSRLDSEYLYHFLSAVDWKKYAAGNEKVKGATLNKEKLAAVEITVPPLAEQKRIVAKLDAICADIQRLQTYLDTERLKIADVRQRSIASVLEKLESGAKNIGEIADLVRGVTYGKTDPVESTAPESIPLLRATNITEKGLSLDELVHIPQRLVRDEQLLRADDIVITMSSGSVSVVGRSVLVKSFERGTFGAFCGVLRPKAQVTGKFLSHVVSTQDIRRAWSESARGTNINNLKRETILGTEIPVPQLQEQVKVSEELDEINENCAGLLHNVERRVTVAAELRQSVLEAAFRGEL